MKLVYVLTHSMALGFVKDQLSFFEQKGIQVTVVTSPSQALLDFCQEEGVKSVGIEMYRSLSPFKDLVSLMQMVQLLRREKPDIVHAGTPKAGLIGMIAAKLCNIPVRIYHIRGFTFRSNLGWKKTLLTLTERVSCKCATAVLAHSPSLKSIALEQGFVDEAKVQVIINGSNGVDSKSLFNPSNFSAKDRMLLRQKFGIAENDLVVSCIARQMIAKGYVELVNAWSLVRAQFPHAWLLVIGHAEEHDALPPETTSTMASDPSIVQVGGIDKNLSPAYYFCSDLIVLPTYREGFPNVPLEAAAMGLPIVATQVEGCTDAVIDGVTGTLVPPKTIEPLAEAITHYLASPELRMKHGNAAQVRVQKEFQREIIWEAQYEFYMSQLKNT